ncbi:MAG: glycosyltransferase [Cytophagaceae bacterium]|nr:glycosyltransferase [Cytophagaceae bacterium]
MMRSLSVIIPTYKAKDLLEEFLPGVIDIAREYQGDWEIIAVDDHSQDESVKFLQELRKSEQRLKVIENEKNLGFSGACNAGMRASKGEILFFLNNDVRLEKGFFNHFNKYFDLPDTFAVTVCAYRLYNSSLLDGAKPIRWSTGMPRVHENYYKEDFQKHRLVPPYLSFAVQGAYFFADAFKTKALGGFDELFSPYIFEETDLSYRALKRSWKIYFEPECQAYHAVSATIGKKRKEALRLSLPETN